MLNTYLEPAIILTEPSSFIIDLSASSTIALIQQVNKDSAPPLPLNVLTVPSTIEPLNESPSSVYTYT